MGKAKSVLDNILCPDGCSDSVESENDKGCHMMVEVPAMLEDVKTGFTLWKRITNLNYAVAQAMLFVAAGFGANLFVAPRLYERIKTISLTLHMDTRTMIMALAAVHIIVFGGMMKRIVYEAWGRNQDFFYQLAVSKKAGRVCTMLQQINWYGYGLVMLLAICGRAAAPGWALFLAYTLLFMIGFGIYYDRADSGSSKRRKLVFCCQTGRRERKSVDFLKRHPVVELFKMTVCGFYQCKSMAAGQLALILFILLCKLFCKNAGMPQRNVFLLANGFLILLNDGYWRKESGNFRYFSEIGIPVGRYVQVHFLAGIGFNVVVPMLFYYPAFGRAAAAAVSFGLLSYLLVFWYLAQIYLYLTLRREQEGAILLCDMVFLVMAAVPPVGLLMTAWLYKRITCKWRGTNACGKWTHKIL